MKFGNLDYSANKAFLPKDNINEGNFISSVPLVGGIVDPAAGSKLNLLTLGKLLEGLDIDDSSDIYELLSVNAPSIADLIGPDKDESTKAIDIIKAQLSYIQSECDTVEANLKSAFSAVLSATEDKVLSADNDKTSEKIEAVTGAEGISSIVPKIDELVKSYKKSGGDLTTSEMKSAFNTLNKLNTSKIVSGVLDSISESASTVSLVSLYKKIDSQELESIDVDNATSDPKIYAGKSFSPDSMISSINPIERIGGFLEYAISMYPFGRKMSTNFGQNYSNLNSNIALSTLKQFTPSIDSSVFSPVSELLNDICIVLINRVAEISEDEIAKNVFTPALQAVWLGMLSVVAMKLINYNLSVEAVNVQKTEDAKIASSLSQKERAMNLKNAYDTLESTGFFDDSTIYWAKSASMKAEQIKNVKYFMSSLGLLSDEAIGSEKFDDALTLAIEKFQRQSKAKKVDGKIGPETRALMEATAKYVSQKYNVA